MGDVVIYNYATASTPGVSFPGYPNNFTEVNQPGVRGLMCLETPWWSATVVACSTHLPTGDGDANRADLVNQIVSKTQQWVNAGKIVVVGGDLNLDPQNNWLNPMYTQRYGGTGSFNDIHQLVCRCRSDSNVWTAESNSGNRRKIDYVFVNYPFVRWDSAANVSFFPDSGSSHLGIRANFTLDLP